MKYLLIKGTLHVIRYSPDGDSMMFKATNPEVWEGLASDHRSIFEKKLTQDNGAVQLRLQGVDALETHYSPDALPTPTDLRGKDTDQTSKPVRGNYKQPTDIGQMATDTFMKLVGVKKAEWRHFGKTTWISKACFERDGQEVWLDRKQADSIPAYIVTSDIEKNGRPLAWVFPGETSDPDGMELTKDQLASRLEHSVNYQLLRRGLVYPYFFMTLAGRLRDKLIEAVRLAQADALPTIQALKAGQIEPTPKRPNLWIYDQSTTTGITITDLNHVTEERELYPYLFRKVVKAWYRQHMHRYWDALRTNSAYTFDDTDRSLRIEALFEDGDPNVFIVSDQDFVKLSEIVQIQDSTLKLMRQPMDIIFLS